MLNTQDSQTLARWPRRLGLHVASNCTLGGFSRRDQPVSKGQALAYLVVKDSERKGVDFNVSLRRGEGPVAGLGCTAD